MYIYRCKTKESKYICPTCNIPYCSAVCYKTHDITCTESFYKKHVIAEVSLKNKGGNRNSDQLLDEKTLSRNTFITQLTKSNIIDTYSEENDNNDDNTNDTTLDPTYATILQNLYDLIDQKDKESILVNPNNQYDENIQILINQLPLSLQQKFFRTINNGELNKQLGLHEWKPWYTLSLTEHNLFISNILQNSSLSSNILTNRYTLLSQLLLVTNSTPCIQYILPLSQYAPNPIDISSTLATAINSTSSSVTFSTLFPSVLSSSIKPVPLDTYLKQKTPSPLLSYHLINILIIYCHLIRLYAGNWNEDEMNVTLAFLEISIVLNPQASTTLLSSLSTMSTVCSLSFEAITNSKPLYHISTVPNMYYSLELLNDVCTILKEPHYIMDALHHILYIFEITLYLIHSKISYSTSISSVNNNDSIEIMNSKDFEKQLQSIVRKILFFISWSYHVFLYPDHDINEFDRIEKQIPSGKFFASQLTNELYEILHEKMLFIQESDQVQRKSIDLFEATVNYPMHYNSSKKIQEINVPISNINISNTTIEQTISNTNTPTTPKIEEMDNTTMNLTGDNPANSTVTESLSFSDLKLRRQRNQKK